MKEDPVGLRFRGISYYDPAGSDWREWSYRGGVRRVRFCGKLKRTAKVGTRFPDPEMESTGRFVGGALSRYSAIQFHPTTPRTPSFNEYPASRGAAYKVLSRAEGHSPPEEREMNKEKKMGARGGWTFFNRCAILTANVIVIHSRGAQSGGARKGHGCSTYFSLLESPVHFRFVHVPPLFTFPCSSVPRERRGSSGRRDEEDARCET